MKAFLKQMIAKRFLYPLNLRLFYWAGHGLGILNSEKELSGEKAFIQNLQKYYGGKEVTIFDVGANVGNYSKMLLDSFANVNIFAFEPHPKTFQALQNNLKDKATLENFGCSDKAEEIEIFGTGVSASILEDVHTELNYQKREYEKNSIKTLVLDSYLQEKSIEKVELLKIDTEGYELNVLKGLVKTISEDKIDFIQFEFNSMNVFNHTFLFDIHKILTNYNFYRLLPNELLKLDVDTMYVPFFHEIFAYQNIVCVRKNIDFYY